jgi:hypothetical protein
MDGWVKGRGLHIRCSFPFTPQMSHTNLRTYSYNWLWLMHCIFILFKRRQWRRRNNLRRGWPFTLHRKLELCWRHPYPVSMESESRRVSSYGNRLFGSAHVLPFSIVLHFDTSHSDNTISVDHQKLKNQLKTFFIFTKKNFQNHL